MAIGDGLNNANNEAQNLNQTLGETQSTFGDLRDTLESINSELGKKINRVKDASKEYSSLTSIAQKLQYQEEGSVRLKDDELNKLKEKAALNLQEIKRSADLLSTEKTRTLTGKSIFDLNQGAFEVALQSLKTRQNLTDEEMALIRAKKDGFQIEQDTVDKVAEEVEKRKEANRLMGVSGGILKGLNALTGEFGAAFKLDKVQADMQKVADKIANGEQAGNRFTVMAAGMGSAIKNAFATITDPATIFAAAIKGFLKVDKANVEFQRQTGQSLNTMSTQAAMANTHFITLGDYIKTASQLTKELGQNAAAIFEPEDILEASEMEHAMGMSVKQSTQLAKLSKINGGNIKEQNKALVEGVNSFNKQNKTAYAAGDILKDVADVSDGIAISYAGYPERLAEAATAAKDLGMNLSDVDKIADSLLNFEQSIAKELEAELVTGKDLNLEKARQAALDNDLATVAKELANQGVSSAEFASMNRIEQEKMASALGMSKDQMAKMLLQQKLSSGISEDALSAAEKQTLEQLKQEEAAEKFKKAVEKIQQALAPIVEPLADILAGVAGIVSGFFQLLGYVGLLKPLLYGIVAVVAMIGIGKAVKGFKEFKDTVTESFEAVKGIGKGVADLASGKGTDSLKSAFGLGDNKAGEAAGKAGEGAGKAADSTKGVKGNMGKEIEKFLKGVGRGLTFIGQNFADILKGSLALLVAAPGLIALGLAAPGLFVLSMIPGPAINAALKGVARGIMFFGKNFGDVAKGALALGLAGLALGGGFALAMMMIKDVDAGQMLAFAGSLTMLGLTMALLGTLGANVFMGAAALAVLGVAMIPAALAFSLLSGLDVGAMIAFSIALPLLALAAAGLGFLAPFIMAGAGALAVLGLALIPASIAFGMLGEVDTEAIMSFTKSVGALALMAAGLGFLSFFIYSGAAALTVLGLALIPLATGFSLMANADGASIVSTLVELAAVSPGLFSTAAALYAVAGGIAAVAVAGYLAVPAMALMSMFGGGGEGGESKKDEGSLKKVEEKLDQLIAIVSAGGDVYMDGEKVGKALQLSSSTMG
jgi:hypothetical protein